MCLGGYCVLCVCFCMFLFFCFILYLCVCVCVSVFVCVFFWRQLARRPFKSSSLNQLF